MKNKGIIIFLIVLAVVVVAVIAGDFVSDRPDKSKPNPFEYNVDDFKNVDPSLIHFKETKNFKMGLEQPAGITIHDEKIYLVGDRQLKVIGLNGKLLLDINLPSEPKTVEFGNENIYIAFKDQINQYDSNGNLLKEWEPLGENALITALAAAGNFIFATDAGNRQVIKYSDEGDILTQFDGKNNDDVLHGFIIPSPYFDMDVNAEGELWVVNPGLHALENYTYEGDLRYFWENTSMKTEGFSGCCNPAHFTFLPDGRFVTSEKGLVRIKVYKESGEFEGVVAAPVKFVDEGNAPDVATDADGNVYALDFDKKLIRVFEHENDTGV